MSSALNPNCRCTHLIKATEPGGQETHNYFYDAGGTRVGKQHHGADPVWSLHVGYDRIEDIDTSNLAKASYIYEPGIDRPVAMVTSTGTTFFHQDVLGNVLALIDSTGYLIEQYRYTVWGKPSVYNTSGVLQSTASPASAFLFTAREYDPETALYHYRARAYSPELGRFLQFDPIDFEGEDLSNYRYVANNPAAFVDPLGLRTEILTGAPVGKGRSRFGHTAVDINGTVYSMGHEGLNKFSREEYLGRNNFRETKGQVLHISCEEELRLKEILERKIKQKPEYCILTQNCVQAVQNGLREAAPRHWTKDWGFNNGTTPIEFSRHLQSAGHVMLTNSYPKTR